MPEMPMNVETKVTWSHAKEISTFLSLSRWWVVLQKQNFTPAPRAGTAWAATSPSLLSTLSSSNHIRWTSVCKPSSNTSPSWVALLQKSLTRLRCHRGCDKNLSHEPAPGLSWTGPFLNCSDQNFSCQDSRRAAPHAATEQYIRGHSRRALHSYFPLNIFPGKHDKYVSEAAGTCQISISTPCCGLRKKKKKPFTAQHIWKVSCTQNRHLQTSPSVTLFISGPNSLLG